MKEDQDDYQADICFGEWLRSQRVRTGLTIEKAAEDSNISIQRLKALEMGLSERGITRSESVRVCTVYQVPLQDLLVQAVKDR
jgi:transcriptional regulator with XRE-family HTH domain